MNRRASGILLHLTCLPSPHGIGDLGPTAYRFADFLAEAKQGFWQVLPLTPTDLKMGHSPYSSSSAFAGNPLLISPELLVADGWLTKAEVEDCPGPPGEPINYPAVMDHKHRLLTLAYERFSRHRRRVRAEFQRFRSESAHWLEDYAVFAALKQRFPGQMWSQWPPELRDRQPTALRDARRHLRESVEKEKFLQFLFYRQWFSLKRYSHERGIQIIGDVPFFLSYDSADVWAHPDLFKLDENKRPTVIAGVPPDYFSRTGQRWGHPLYRWEVLQQRGYEWWLRRLEHHLQLFDLVRIDHFRGFAACWEVPAEEETAIHGRWVEVPGDSFLATLFRRLPHPRLLAEDLGTITPDVRELMRRYQIPGMRVLLFAFGGDPARNPHLPHNYVPDCVVYTGTHDNNTVRGWFETEARPYERTRVFHYLGRRVSASKIHWEFIRLALMSTANLAIIPLQDVLGLGQAARMNRPAITSGNWRWRFSPELLTPALAQTLAELTEIYGRA